MSLTMAEYGTLLGGGYCMHASEFIASRWHVCEAKIPPFYGSHLPSCYAYLLLFIVDAMLRCIELFE